MMFYDVGRFGAVRLFRPVIVAFRENAYGNDGDVSVCVGGGRDVLSSLSNVFYSVGFRS